MFGKRPKELAIIVFVCLYSLVVFGAFSITLTFQDSLLLILAGIVLGIALIGWVSIISLAAMLTAHHKVSSLAVSIVPSLSLAVVGMGSLISISAAVLLAIIVYVGQRLIVRELDDRIKFSIPRIFRDSIKVIASGLLISLLGLAMPSFTENVDIEELRIPEKYVEIIILPLEPLINNFIPSYDSKKTLNEMIEAQFNQGNTKAVPEMTMSPQEKEVVRQNMSNQLGEDLDGQETLSTIVAERLNNYLQYLLEFNPMIIATSLILLAFLTLRVLIPLIVWPAFGMMYFLVRIMLMSGFMRKELQEITVERLHL